MIAIVLGTFVTVLNNSFINVALPKLVNIFGSTTQDMQWVLTGYMLASAVVIPMSGTIGDKFGYKKTFVIALSFFTIMSLLCGLAWGTSSLIAFRIFQGVSGGFIMPVGMSMIYMIMPREKIGMALGLWGVAAMAAPAVGPTLSGYLIEYFSWRILFFINIPVGIFAVVSAFFLLKETPTKQVKFDYAGAILSVLCFGSLLWALSKGPSEGWDSLYIVSLLYIAISCFILLLYVELTKDQPLLDFRVFKIPVFTISVFSSGLVMMGMFGGVFLTPLYLQNVQMLTPVDAGLVMMPQSIAMAVMMPISGRLFDKVGALPLALVGLTLMGTTTYELHRLTLSTPNTWLDTVLTIRGLGMGLCMMPLSTVGMNAVPREIIGKASSVSNLTRQVMGSMAIAILTAIMNNRATFHAAQISESVTTGSDVVNSAISSIAGYYTAGGVDAATASGGATSYIASMIQMEAMVRSIGDTFLISAIPMFVVIPFVWFLRKRRQPKAAPAAPVAEKPAAAATKEQTDAASLKKEPEPQPVS
nr:DHA2 family efflux MFS transporter permease subunit [Brevibacillus fulvus]